jgi:hypothetical protein
VAARRGGCLPRRLQRRQPGLRSKRLTYPSDSPVALGISRSCRFDLLNGPARPHRVNKGEKSMSSKAARGAGIIGLMLTGFCAILFGWVFFVDRLFPTPVDLHSVAKVDVDSWDKGFVSALGTWRAGREHERMLYLTLGRPLNISTINCIQQSGFCDVATTTLNHTRSSGYSLDLVVNRLEIKNWNSAILEFSAGDPAYHCFIENYVITRTTKKVTGLSTASGNCSAAFLREFGT